MHIINSFGDLLNKSNRLISSIQASAFVFHWAHTRFKRLKISFNRFVSFIISFYYSPKKRKISVNKRIYYRIYILVNSRRLEEKGLTILLKWVATREATCSWAHLRENVKVLKGLLNIICIQEHTADIS